MSDNNQQKTTPKRKRFEETYKGFDDSQILRETLFAQQLQLEKLESIRSNTSKLVWWLIAIPFVLFFMALVLGIGSSF